MHAPHQGGQAVRSLFETELVIFKRGDKEEALPLVAGSASLKGKILFVTLTNTHASSAVEARVNLLGGAAAKGVTARILSGEIHAHNTFDQPEALIPQPFELRVFGRFFSISLPPASGVGA